MPLISSMEELAKEEGIQIGEQRGIQIGEQRGIQIGEQRGIQIGEQQALEKTARNMLVVGLDPHQIAQVTGLSLEQIQQLQTQIEPQ